MFLKTRVALHSMLSTVAMSSLTNWLALSIFSRAVATSPPSSTMIPSSVVMEK